MKVNNNKILKFDKNKNYVLITLIISISKLTNILLRDVKQINF